MTQIAAPPKSPSVSDAAAHTFRPEETNPDLAAAAMVKELMAKFPTPAIVSKKFSVYQGILEAQNHTVDNPTGFNCTPRLLVYRSAAETSVNVDGKLFTSVWAYLMHPNYIIQGMPQTMVQEEQPGLISRMFGKITGKGSTTEAKT